MRSTVPANTGHGPEPCYLQQDGCASASEASLGIVLTRSCPARCTMCMTSSGPEERAWMDEDLIREILVQASSLSSIRSISLTGGEPFSRFALLSRIVAECHALGMDVSITTNAYWAMDADRVEARLRLLSDTGRVSLMTSADLFHQEFVPIVRVRRLVAVAGRLGIPVAVNKVLQRADRGDVDCGWWASQGVEVAASQFVPVGRAAELPDAVWAPEPDPEQLAGPCYAATRSVTLDVDGTAYGCCGLLIPEHIVGRFPADSLADIVAKTTGSPIQQALAELGPVAVARVLSADIRGARSQCGVCLELVRNSTVNLLNLDEAQQMGLELASRYVRRRRAHADCAGSDAAAQ